MQRFRSFWTLFTEGMQHELQVSFVSSFFFKRPHMEEPTGPAAMVKSLFPSVFWYEVDSHGGGCALNTLLALWQTWPLYPLLLHCFVVRKAKSRGVARSRISIMLSVLPQNVSSKLGTKNQAVSTHPWASCHTHASQCQRQSRLERRGTPSSFHSPR